MDEQTNVPELIARDNIAKVWPIIGPRLDRAMRKVQFVEYDLPYVLNLLMREQAQLWVGNMGGMFAITRIVSYPNVKRLIIDFIEGTDFMTYKEHLEYIEHWAVSQGATQAETQIRPGLLKSARANGWKKPRIKVFKALNQGLH